MNAAIGTIKSTLKLFRNPNPDNYKIILTRLQSVAGYHNVVLDESTGSYWRKIVFAKDLSDLPSWLVGMNERLGRHCNVYILPIAFQKPGIAEPIKAMCVMGKPDNIALAEAYILYLHNAVKKHSYSKTRRLRMEAKKVREKARKGQTVSRLDDIRFESSEYRKDLLNMIHHYLDMSLDIQRTAQSATFWRNEGERNSIENYLKLTYGLKWRSVLSRVTL